VEFLRADIVVDVVELLVWRRSKLGLRMSEAEVQDLDAYLGALQARRQMVDQRGASVG
jgi:hypothetical protein